MNFTECDKQGTVEGYAVVRSCEKKNAKNGTVFLDMVLSDRSGEINAKLWDFKDGVHPLPEVNTLVKARGTLQTYNNSDQFIVSRIRPVTESDGVRISDYVKASDYDGSVMFREIVTLAEGFKNAELKMLVTAIYNENREQLLFFPAAYKLHHAMNGGLLYHTLSVVRLAQSVAAIYPFIDRELLLAGAMLHDIAKLREFNVNSTGLADSYSVRGELLGHLVMGAVYVDEKCRELGISEETAVLVEHMLVSHHGIPDYGAAVRPSFIEAEVLSQLDLLDAELYEMAEALSGVQPEGFTSKLWAMDNRKFYNHGRTVVAPKADLLDGRE